MFLRAKRGQMKVIITVTLMAIIFFLIAMMFRRFLDSILK
jgi:hypothetical protein